MAITIRITYALIINIITTAMTNNSIGTTTEPIITTIIVTAIPLTTIHKTQAVTNIIINIFYKATNSTRLTITNITTTSFSIITTTPPRALHRNDCHHNHHCCQYDLQHGYHYYDHHHNSPEILFFPIFRPNLNHNSHFLTVVTRISVELSSYYLALSQLTHATANL
jgi:hypothetical protein